MPNTLITPEWIAKDLARGPYTVWERPRLTSQSPKWERAIQLINDEHRASAPVDPRVVVALGTAAIVANPTPISRRALFGLAWKGKR